MKIRQWLFEYLFGAESRRLDVAEAWNRTRAQQVDGLMAELATRPPRPPPARFKLEGAISPAEIAGRLRGAEKTPMIQAVLAHLGAKVVELCDKSTDVPRGETHLRGGEVLPAFTETERLHFCGQAAGVAEILAELQDLTAATEEEPPEKSAA